MCKSDFSDEAVAPALAAVAAGTVVSAACVEHGGGRTTHFDWNSHFGTLDARGVGRVCGLEKENSEPRIALRSLQRDINALRTVLESRVLTATERRDCVEALKSNGLSERRSLEIVWLPRAKLHYQDHPDRQAWLLLPLMDVARAHPEYGYRRLRIASHSFLSKRGVDISLNHKTVHRMCREADLSLPRRRSRDRVTGERPAPPSAKRANVVQAMDFMSDRLWAGGRDGRSFRLLNMLDVGTREGLAIGVDYSLPAQRVVEVLYRVALERGHPTAPRLDNGTEFNSGAVRRWAGEHVVTLCFSRLGTPTENPYIESFNGRCREECLNRHDFRTLGEAREILEAWRGAYNTERPHSRPGNLPLAVYSDALEGKARKEDDREREREKTTTSSARAAGGGSANRIEDNENIVRLWMRVNQGECQ